MTTPIQFPTCPTHAVMKPCPHCEPPAQKYVIRLCGDADQGDELVPCPATGCGLLMSRYRTHGYTRPRSMYGYGGGYDPYGD